MQGVASSNPAAPTRIPGGDVGIRLLFLLSSSTPSLLYRAFSLIDCFVASFLRLSHIVCCSIFLVPMKVVFFGINGKIPFNSRIFLVPKIILAVWKTLLNQWLEMVLP